MKRNLRVVACCAVAALLLGALPEAARAGKGGGGGGGGRGGAGGGGRAGRSSGGFSRGNDSRSGGAGQFRPDRGSGRGGGRGGQNGGGGRWRSPYWYYPGSGFFFGASLWNSPYFDPWYGGYGYGRDEDRERKIKENIEVKVSPESAAIYVNGVLYSKKGRTRFNLPIGPWTVELRAPGYVTQVLELNVEQGVRYSIERKLEKDPAATDTGSPRQIEDL